MPNVRQYAVLGPLPSAVETRGFLGCEMRDGLPVRNRRVVIVWLPDAVTADPEVVARLQRETAEVTGLRHANIVRVYGMECFEEGWARVVDYGQGEPLAAVLAEARAKGLSVPPRIAARIVADLCAGVHHAHDEGSQSQGAPLVHGGLRPDTVLAGFDGVSRVTGYGASSWTPDLTLRNRNVYLAPEQVIGGRNTASVATDVYALGAMLYELVGGKPPFAGEDDVDTAIMMGAPAALEVEGLSSALADVASRAMSRKGADRYPGVAALRESIVAACDASGLASADEVSTFIDDLIPPDSSERAGRENLLDSAADPDTVTVLSLRDAPPDDVDPELFEAARPQTSNTDLSAPASPAGDDDAEPSPSSAAQEPTMVTRDRSAPTKPAIHKERDASDWGREASDGRGEAAGLATVEDIASPAGDDASGDFDGQTLTDAAVDDDGATEAADADDAAADANDDESADANDDESADAEPTAVASAPMRAPLPREAATVIADPPGAPQASVTDTLSDEQVAEPEAAKEPEPEPEAAEEPEPEPEPEAAKEPEPEPEAAKDPEPEPEPAKAAASASSRPPADRAATVRGEPEQMHVTLGPRDAAETTSRIPGRRPVAQPSYGDETSGPVPRAPIREDSITAFRKDVGDSSRSVLFLVIIGAAAVLFSIFYFGKKADPALTAKSERKLLPREALDLAMKTRKADELPSHDDVGQPALVPPTTDEGDVTQEPVAKTGTFSVKTVPTVDVYIQQQGKERHLGRTPVSIDVPAGQYQVRFTDKEKRLTKYKRYRIMAGGVHRDTLEFMQAELTINAPAGARVELNGDSLGEAPVKPLKVYEGKYFLIVSKDGRVWKKGFEAPPGGKLTYNVKLK